MGCTALVVCWCGPFGVGGVLVWAVRETFRFRELQTKSSKFPISYVLDYANVAELLEKYIRNRILVTVLYVLECSKTFHAKLIIKVNTYETVNKAPHDFVSP